MQTRNGLLDVTRSNEAGTRRLLVNFGGSAIDVPTQPGSQALVTSGKWAEGVLGAMSAVVLART